MISPLHGCGPQRTRHLTIVTDDPHWRVNRPASCPGWFDGVRVDLTFRWGLAAMMAVDPIDGLDEGRKESRAL